MAAQQCLAARSANIDKNVIELLEKVDTLPEEIGEILAQKLYRLLQSSTLFNNKEHGESIPRSQLMSRLTEPVVKDLRYEAVPNNTIVGTTKHLLQPATYSEYPM